MKFEKRPRKVIYLSNEDIYRATSDAVTAKDRAPIAEKRRLVGIATAVTYWDNVDRREHCLGCARTIKEAWLAGDRYLLDTDEAKKAAELVTDLADTKPDAIDICSALMDLLNAIAKVRLADTKMEDFEVQQICTDAITKCFETPGYTEWSGQARRRRFLYELKRKHRTPVTYTLMGLYFEYGATPLLTAKQRHELMSLDRGEGPEGASLFFDNCLRQMTAYLFLS